MDVLGLLHDSDEYGVLRWPLADLANAAGVPIKALRELIDKDVLKGADKGFTGYTWAPSHAGKLGEQVTLVDASASPVWFCSRFVKSRFDADNQPPKPEPKAEPNLGIGSGFGYGPSSASSSALALVATTPLPVEPADALGQFEGQDAKPPAPNPVAPLAVALIAAGFRCTSLNPDLIAYHREGGTAEHLEQIAGLAECHGKPATYVIRFARRELSQPAATIPPGTGATRRPEPAHNPGGVSPRLSANEESARKVEALELQRRQFADLGVPGNA